MGPKTRAEQDIPTSRVGRLARLAAAGLRTGVGLIGRGDASTQAIATAALLGQMRGLAAKVGQMAGYVDGVVPEAHRPAFESALKVLRDQAPRSSSQAVRRLVEQELGAPIDRTFARWDDEPIASASIGQVHRARLTDALGGGEVAVKVQHPGIVEAVEADLANAGLLEKLANQFGAQRFDASALLATLRERFREELDYELEASRMTLFARIHAGDPTIRIPVPIPGRCSRRVLTSPFVSGLTFDEACARPESERAAWARTLWRFVYKGNIVGGVFNADPHPGNYVFGPDGVVSFLDFGCVQHIGRDRIAHARALHRLAVSGDLATFDRMAAEIVDARPGRLQVMAQAYMRRTFEPVIRSPYKVTRTYAASLFDDMKHMAKVAVTTPADEFFTLPPDALFLNRMHFGFYSVLARLDVTVDYAEVERGYHAEIPDGDTIPFM